MPRLAVFATWLSVLSAPIAAGQGPLSPEASRATFRLADPELVVELVAAEPDVRSPVAVAWDEDGRMYVAEMLDYPAGPGKGDVRLLEDRDGDGRYERATTFAEGLSFPSSVLPWDGGVLVATAPDVLFLKDEDGDGRADVRRAILTGFGEGNTQLRVNGLSWGVDGWVYGANGRSDGVIRRPGDPDSAAVPLRLHDFRFRPETGEVVPVSGFSQFGLPRDDWGRRFPSWNTVPIRQVVLEGATLARNPYLAESATVAEILDPADGGRVFPASPPPTTFNRESTAYFNATCGPTIVRGGLLGESYRGNALFCESLTNLVQRRILEPRGVATLARRAEPDREFLAAADPCFRPVYLANGPDGALYVVDFYREMVEHPAFVPAELRETIDFRRWNERGRIWRVARRGSPRPPPPRMGGLEAEGLVAALADPNGWVRDAAQRLLVGRKALAAVPRLEAAAAGGGTAVARMQAVWTLAGLGALRDDVLAARLSDPSAEVREAALKLAGGRPAAREAVAALARDPSPRVRLQAAILLGDREDPAGVAALAGLAAADADDDWIRLAVLSGLRETASPFLDALLDAHPAWLTAPTPGQARLLGSTAAIVGARARAGELRSLAARMDPGDGDASFGGRAALLLGLSEGLARAGKPPRGVLVGGDYAGVGRLINAAARLVDDEGAAPQARAKALTLLARFRPDEAARRIPALLGADRPPDLQGAAAAAIAELGSPALLDGVIGAWETIPTRTRRGVLGAVIRSRPMVERLLSALESGAVGTSELTPADRSAIQASAGPEAAKRAAALFATGAGSRSEVLARFQPALGLVGRADRGEELFAKNCLACHQHRGAGSKVGPDLSGVASRPPSALLKDLLDPNADVSPDFVAYTVATLDGRMLSGLLAEESASSLKLLGAEGVQQTVLRSEVEAVRRSGRSLMPEGFEDALGEQGLADVIAFLKRP